MKIYCLDLDSEFMIKNDNLEYGLQDLIQCGQYMTDYDSAYKTWKETVKRAKNKYSKELKEEELENTLSIDLIMFEADNNLCDLDNCYDSETLEIGILCGGY